MLYICFRIFRSANDKDAVETSLESKLKRLVGESNFRVDPTEADTPFNEYIQFTPSAGAQRWGGEENWKEYMLILARLSKIVADLARTG